MAYFLTELASLSIPLSVAGRPKVLSRFFSSIFDEIVFLISCVQPRMIRKTTTHECFIKRSVALCLIFFFLLGSFCFPGYIYGCGWLDGGSGRFLFRGTGQKDTSGIGHGYPSHPPLAGRELSVVSVSPLAIPLCPLSLSGSRVRSSAFCPLTCSL